MQALEKTQAELVARLRSGGPAELERLRAEAAGMHERLAESTAAKVDANDALSDSAAAASGCRAAAAVTSSLTCLQDLIQKALAREQEASAALRQQLQDASAASASAAQASAAELAARQAAAAQATEAVRTAQRDADTDRQRADSLAAQLADTQDAVKVSRKISIWTTFGTSHRFSSGRCDMWLA
jgi:hypothetical protein